MAYLRQNGGKRRSEKKKKKKKQPTAVPAVPLDTFVPWRCTTRFRPADRLCQPEMVPATQFDTLSHDKTVRGGKSAPRPYETDLFRTSPSTSTDLNWDSATYKYIWTWSHFVFHVVRLEVWEYAHVRTIVLSMGAFLSVKVLSLSGPCLKSSLIPRTL